MQTEQFVKIIKQVVSNSSVSGVQKLLKSPPGRQPDPNLINISNFYNSLTTSEQGLINEIIRFSVDEAVFGFLCVLDGVRAIEDDEIKGDLILTYKKCGRENILNENSDLHDIYNWNDID